jgi:ubiquinone/menaquinone biosynthesis C-methylase UbiE
MSTAPDIETSSEGYASRFSGRAGTYLLEVQGVGMDSLISEFSGQSVLDVGGGHGQLLGVYRRNNMQVNLHGSDPECFARLARDEEIEFFVSDIFALPFGDRSVDVVTAVRLVSHVDEWPALLKEMCRVARVCVIIDYPSKRSLNALTPLLFGLKRGIEKNTRTYISFSHRQLRKEFTRYGFAAVTEYKQFLLPMVVHRTLGGGKLPRAIEKVCRAVGLTRLFGSPILLKATRTRS